MFDRMVVQEALKRSWEFDNNPGIEHPLTLTRSG